MLYPIPDIYLKDVRTSIMKLTADVENEVERLENLPVSSNKDNRVTG